METTQDVYLTEDGKDRRAALEAAIQVFGESLEPPHAGNVLTVAEAYYRWLRERDSLLIELTITAGIPAPQPAAD